MMSFFSINPDVTRDPAHFPKTISLFIAPDGPDWTSPGIHKLFVDTISTALHTNNPLLVMMLIID